MYKYCYRSIQAIPEISKFSRTLKSLKVNKCHRDFKMSQVPYIGSETLKQCRDTK